MTDTHTTKDGREMLIKDMSDNHLINTIAYIEKRAKGEFVVGMEGYIDGDVYCERIVLTKDEALNFMNYEAYTNERDKRLSQKLSQQEQL